MSPLLEALRADAAQHLPLPPGRRPSQEVPRYKRYLRRSLLRTRYAHHQGASGREIVQARTLAVDLVFSHAFEAARTLPEYAATTRTTPCAIVALGGYGRGELSPHSDIDVQFLHQSPDLHRSPRPPFLALLEDSWIFNVFPKVQNLVRTPAESVTAGNQDWRSKTSLIEARLVCGDEPLFTRLQRRLISGCVTRQEHAYVAQRLADQADRRQRFGNTPFLQEPHLKNGCGGLRDYQNLLWLAFFRYRTPTTAALQEQGLISPAERAELDRAYEFLLRVRNDLHFRSDRTQDVLLKALQPAVARAMGYLDGSPSKRVDRLMRAYYTHARHLHDLTRILEERLALAPQPGRLPRLKDFLRARRRRAAYEVDGFKFVDGCVIPVSDRIFHDRPPRLLQAFFNAQRRRLRLHPELLQLIRDQTALVTPAFRRDPTVAQMFLELLKARGQVAPALRQMHEARLLGAYLPAFGRLTARVQHEFFHLYTTDEHTLVCLEKLDEVWHESDPALRPYAEMFRRLERPEILYLALLLHDIGKGEGRDHAESGARIAASVCRQLHLDDAAARRVQFLVRHHLAMVTVAQKRNLGDPHVIQTFADLVGDLENLRALALLTLADSRGTSDRLWTAFKDALHLTLFHRAQEHLEGQGAVAADAERARLLDAVQRAAPPDLQPDEIQAHFQHLPARYFIHALAEDVLADLHLAHAFFQAQVAGSGHPLDPIVHWQTAEPRGCSVARCCTWDRPGVFAQLAGAFTAARLNILSADIYSRTDGLVLDTFHVTDAATGSVVSPRSAERFRTLARAALTGPASPETAVQPASLPPAAETPAGSPAIPSDRWKTSVVFDNLSSPAHTIIEIEAADRLGLLHTIAWVLARLGVDIALARIHTANGGASDAFYVSDTAGHRITDPARQKAIRTALLQALRGQSSLLTRECQK